VGEGVRALCSTYSDTVVLIGQRIQNSLCRLNVMMCNLVTAYKKEGAHMAHERGSIPKLSVTVAPHCTILHTHTIVHTHTHVVQIRFDPRCNLALESLHDAGRHMYKERKKAPSKTPSPCIVCASHLGYIYLDTRFDALLVILQLAET